MKKFIYYSIIVLSLITIFTFGYLFYKIYLGNNKIYDTSQLSTVSVNGHDYKTTGSIPTQDEKRQESFNQTIRLASMKGITNSQYSVNVSQYGEITVTLFQPFDTNKIAFTNWIKENNFDGIDPSKFNFLEAK